MREVAAQFERPVLLFSGRQGLDPDGAPGARRRSRRRASRSRWSTSTRATTSRRRSSSGTALVEQVRRDPARRARCRRRSTRGAVEGGGGPEPQPQPPPDGDAPGHPRRAEGRRGPRRRTPRRGEGPGQGALLQPPRPLRPVGPEEPAARALEPLQRAQEPRASTSASSRSPTGPRWTSGSTSRPRTSRCPRSTSPTGGRWSAGTACCWPGPPCNQLLDGERWEELTVRFRTIGDATCTGATESTAATPGRDHRRGGRRPGHGARAVAATTAAPRPPWKTARSRGTSEWTCLRFTTAGRVDDGKSTLIGRLLYDTKSIFEDQLEAVEDASRRRGEGYVNLALLTDGLRAEREQNITIDVAYRYFATPRRKFIIADTPGHIQYTRNMVTGASTAELAIVLIDARNGVLTQSKRHGFIASLLGIPHIVVAVNKMDLVDWSEERVRGDRGRVHASSPRSSAWTTSPSSRSRRCSGTTWWSKSANMPWYDGPHAPPPPGARERRRAPQPGGLPLSRCSTWCGPTRTTVATPAAWRPGPIRPGEEIVVLPSGRTTRVASVDTFDGAVDEAVAGRLGGAHHRGRAGHQPRRHDRPAAEPAHGRVTSSTPRICWTSEEPMKPGAAVLAPADHARGARPSSPGSCTASTWTRCIARRRTTSSSTTSAGSRSRRPSRSSSTSTS